MSRYILGPEHVGTYFFYILYIYPYDLTRHMDFTRKYHKMNKNNGYRNCYFKHTYAFR